MPTSPRPSHSAAQPQGGFDVAIVGFGPTGAVLAGLLGKRGLKVAVIDREVDVYRFPRAAHIDHTGLRTLQELGCLEAMLPTMLANPGLDLVTASGELLVRLPGNQGSLSGLPASMYFHQPSFDRTVRSVSQWMPNVQVLLGCELRGLAQGSDGTLLSISGPGRAAAELEASWVVGCDGAASSVRDEVGIDLEDLGFEEEWLVVDLNVRGKGHRLPRSALSICDRLRPITTIPMPGTRHRFEFKLLESDEAQDMRRPERIRELVQAWVSSEETEIERTATYTFHGLVAHEWRKGRVLVAGDAAHQMPPFLGQGMCSGIRTRPTWPGSSTT
jgi:3-(3-hydroxy-phenyl)propionate hydroxylase